MRPHEDPMHHHTYSKDPQKETTNLWKIIAGRKIGAWERWVGRKLNPFTQTSHCVGGDGGGTMAVGVGQ